MSRAPPSRVYGPVARNGRGYKELKVLSPFFLRDERKGVRLYASTCVEWLYNSV